MLWRGDAALAAHGYGPRSEVYTLSGHALWYLPPNGSSVRVSDALSSAHRALVIGDAWRGALAWSSDGVQAVWLTDTTDTTGADAAPLLTDAPSLQTVQTIQTIPGSATACAAALDGRDALTLHGGASPRLERWRLRPRGFDEPLVTWLSEPMTSPLSAHLIPTPQGVRVAWIERRRAVWGAPKGLVRQHLPIELEALTWAGMSGGRAYFLAQQQHAAVHGPWWWLVLDLARPDAPLWMAPALRSGLQPLAATACERHGLLVATREGIWWFDRQAQRRDLIPWPHPDAEAAAQHATCATLSVDPSRRDLLLSFDNTLWRWNMKPLRGRALPILKPLRVPQGLAALDLEEATLSALAGDAPAAVFAQPTGVSAQGLIGWRRRGAPPCYTKPPQHTPSHVAGAQDLAVSAHSAWELFSQGVLRRRGPDLTTEEEAVLLIIPPPDQVHASPDGSLAVAGPTHITWLRAGHTPFASLPVRGTLPRLSVSASRLGWVIGDDRAWSLITPTADGSLALSLRAPRRDLPGSFPTQAAHTAPHTLSLLDADGLWDTSPHQPLTRRAPLPPNTLHATLEPTGRALAALTPQGVITWPALDPAQETRALFLPADLIGWLDGDLLLHYQGESWRVTPPSPAPAQTAPTPSPSSPKDDAATTDQPLAPPYHVVIDLTDLDAKTRESLTQLAAEASERWPEQPPPTLTPLLLRAAHALATSQRLHALTHSDSASTGTTPPAMPQLSADPHLALPDAASVTTAQDIALIRQRADATLALSDLDDLRPLLDPNTFERLL
jgi:hypothetical protein